MTDMFLALTRGHWPSVIGAWLHLTVSFMVWLLMGALSLTLAQDFHLSQIDTALVVALPLLSGALLRVVAGWSSDWYGAKPTGVLILMGELAVVLWGWLGVHSYVELLLVAALLGIGGASFAVTLPLAGRTYPAAHQGWVLGIVASGNVGTVLILFAAPRIAATGGWHDVFGWMILPLVFALAVFVLLVRDDRQSRRAERDTHWWHNVAVMTRHPKAYWLCGLYAVTFGGFGIWWLYDMVLLAAGEFRDIDDLPLRRWTVDDPRPYGGGGRADARVQEVEERLEALRDQFNDLAERVDFAERMLAQQRERPQLPRA